MNTIWNTIDTAPRDDRWVFLTGGQWVHIDGLVSPEHAPGPASLAMARFESTYDEPTWCAGDWYYEDPTHWAFLSAVSLPVQDRTP
jgi:hypothetical protein